MKEIISISLGTHSNHVASHFWNSQDENLKVVSALGEPNTEQVMRDTTSAIYHETASST